MSSSSLREKLKPYLRPLTDNQRLFLVALLDRATETRWHGAIGHTVRRSDVVGNQSQYSKWRKEPEFLKAFEVVEALATGVEIDEAADTVDEAIATVERARVKLALGSEMAADKMIELIQAEKTVQVGFEIGDNGKPIPVFESENDNDVQFRASKEAIKLTMESDTSQIVKHLNPFSLHPVLRTYWRENSIRSWRDILKMLHLTGEIKS